MRPHKVSDAVVYFRIKGHLHTQRRRMQFESGGTGTTPEIFFEGALPFWLVPPLTGAPDKCATHNVVTVILAILNEERKT